MRRKELEELGLEKEVIDKVMSINGADVEKAKAGIDEKQKAIDELNEKINALGGTSEELTQLKEKIKFYETSEEERKANEEKEKADAEFKDRFSKVVGENKFRHTDIEQGRFNAFKEALKNKDNTGKGDAEIFESITKDLDCFVNPQQAKITLPANGKNTTNYKSQMDEIYKNNPFYRG